MLTYRRPFGLRLFSLVFAVATALAVAPTIANSTRSIRAGDNSLGNRVNR